ncbi:MAG: NAD(P)H-dependent oxidoreductase subunit E, partial [Gammaproteobacteria bacterium]
MTNPKQSFVKRGHPGAGKKKTRNTPKGRQVEPAALGEIRELLGDRPMRSDLLIEHLHLIQDRFGHLSARHLAALADLMRLPLAAVYEVATFYAHFDVVKEGEAPPAPLTVRVCDSIACELAGAQAIVAELASKAGREVRVVHAPCMGRCDTAPVAMVGQQYVDRAGVESILEAVAAGATEPQLPDYVDYDAYVKEGGYRL